MIRIGFGRRAPRHVRTPFQQALLAVLERTDIPVSLRLQAVHTALQVASAPHWTRTPTLDQAKRYVSSGKHFPAKIPPQIVHWITERMQEVYSKPPKLPIALALDYYLHRGRYSHGDKPAPEGDHAACIEYALDDLVAGIKEVVRWAAETDVDLAGLSKKKVMQTATAWNAEMDRRRARRRKLAGVKW